MRRIVSGVVVATAIVLLLASTFVDKLSIQAGIAITVVAILFFVTLLVDHVMMVRSESEIEIFVDEVTALSTQQQYIRSRRPRSVRMLEYSGYSVTTLLSELSDSIGTQSIKLLLCDPRDAPEWHRVYRILPVIASLPLVFGGREDLDLQVRCYTSPASLRGRNYGDSLVVTGWYTHDQRNGQPDNEQMWGGHNALVMAPCDNPSGIALRTTFNRVFDSIWDDSPTLGEVITSYPDVMKHMEAPWLQRVSSESPSTDRESGVTSPSHLGVADPGRPAQEAEVAD
jgi:hypothetical protein